MTSKQMNMSDSFDSIIVNSPYTFWLLAELLNTKLNQTHQINLNMVSLLFDLLLTRWTIRWLLIWARKKVSSKKVSHTHKRNGCNDKKSKVGKTPNKPHTHITKKKNQMKICLIRGWHICMYVGCSLSLCIIFLCWHLYRHCRCQFNELVTLFPLFSVVLCINLV